MAKHFVVLSEANLIEGHKREAHVPRTLLYGLLPVSDDVMVEAAGRGQILQASHLMTRPVNSLVRKGWRSWWGPAWGSMLPASSRASSNGSWSSREAIRGMTWRSWLSGSFNEPLPGAHHREAPPC